MEPAPTKQLSSQYSCCAIGCRDRSLSIWLTSLKRPLVVVHDLFNHSIMDVSWSQSGFELLVCSWDGTIAYADFSPDELGKAMSQEEKEKFHKQVYGISISSNRSKFASSIIENPDMLKIQQRHIMKQQTLANSTKPAVPPPPLVSAGTPTKQDSSQMSNGAVTGSPANSKACFQSPNSAINQSKINIQEKQTETRTKDGRRRITPVLVAQMDVNDTPLPFGSSSLPPPPPPSTVSAADTAKIRTTTQNMSALDSRIGENATTGFSDRPKEYKVPEKAEMLAVKSTTVSKAVPSVTTTATVSVASSSTTSVSVSIKRKSDTSTSGTKRARKDSTAHGKTVSTSCSSRQREERTDHEESSAVMTVVRHPVCIPSPGLEKSLTVQIGASGGDPGVTLELENNLSPSAHGVHVLKCTSAGKLCWEAIITSPGIALAGNRNVVCVACANKSVCIFSFGGRRIQPAFILDTPASILQCSGHYVMLVTSSGGVYVWDTKSSSVVVKNESAYSILSAGADVTIARASISDRGHPVITLSNQSSFSFDPTVGTWVQLVRADDPLMLNADYQAIAPRQDPFYARGPLSQLQGQCTRLARQGGRLFRSNPGRQKTATISHLENQLSVCLTLGSGNEYHFWLLTYVRFLVQAGCESRLREVCDEFLGPPHRSNSQEKRSGWSPKILGFTRRDLLREILPIIGTNIHLQRLFTEFKDQLDTTQMR